MDFITIITMFSLISKEAEQEIMMKELKGQNNFEARQRLIKLKNDLKKMQLGLVTKINLPSIK